MRESTGTHQLCIRHPIVLLGLCSSCQSTSHKGFGFDPNLTLFDNASCRCSSCRQQITDKAMLKKCYVAMETLKAVSSSWDMLVPRSHRKRQLGNGRHLSIPPSSSWEKPNLAATTKQQIAYAIKSHRFSSKKTVMHPVSSKHVLFFPQNTSICCGKWAALIESDDLELTCRYVIQILNTCLTSAIPHDLGRTSWFHFGQ